MTSADVPARVQSIAEYFLSLSSHDVDMLLQMVKSNRSVPGGWKDAPDRIKLINIQRILMDLPDDSLALLEKLLFDDRPILANALGNHFANLPEASADDALTLVSVGHLTPREWDKASYDVKSIIFKKIVMDMTDGEAELLADYLPDGERERLAKVSVPASRPVPERADSSDTAVPASRPERSAESIIPQPESAIEVKSMPDGPIFIVHGHARAVLHEAVRVLERGTGKDVIVLHEQASAGRTILEKFEDYAADVSFAVVLLTGDDEGGMRASSEAHPRGRQNVIFELGFFFGKLGRQRVVVLLEENVERPSDIAGLVYINLDQSGAWKYSLARELEAAGISVDRARIP